MRLANLLSLVLSLCVGVPALSGCRAAPERVFRAPDQTSSAAVASSASSELVRSSVSSASSFSSASSVVSAPKSVLIEMPFQSQAPLKNWDALHQESCEEASLLLVAAYLRGETALSPEEMESRIQELVAWETAHGYGEDVTIEELGEIARERFGLTPTILRDVDAATLREQLGQGRPVIAPFAGRMLGNPNYTGDGPWYHVLVVLGYDEDEFVTHDVGTRNGENYRYAHSVLLDALHDWTGVKERTAEGPKEVLVVEGTPLP